MSCRRVFAFAFVLIGAGVIAFLIWPRPPRLVRDLQSLPEVRDVEWKGEASNYLTVLHLRDWHYITPEMAKIEGIDHSEHLADVEKVQTETVAILRHLITEHDVRTIYAEGLTEENKADFDLRVQALRDTAKLEDIGGLDDEHKALQRLLRLQVGAAGWILERKGLDQVLPLEDHETLHAAKPIKDGKVVFDDAAIEARRQAMVKNLPAQGLVVIILGGSHDLGPYLPSGTRYVRVTPRSYPGE